MRYNLYFLTISLIINGNLFAQDSLFSQEKLIQDTREIIRIIDTVHPDPYINGGGKIAFHRRFHNILKGIPIEGMSLNDFYKLLLPIVANIRDLHTFLIQPNLNNRSVLPLEFKIIDNKLFIAGIYSKDHYKLYNSSLYSVEGILYPELVNRLKDISGFENEVGYISKLKEYLKSRFLFKMLIPEWSEIRPVTTEFINQDGQRILEQFIVSDSLGKPIYKNSNIKIPSTDQVSIAYNFIDDKRKTAILCVKNMWSSREDLEISKYFSNNPEDIKNLDLKIPKSQSASDLFRQLSIDMKKARSNTLIVDLRGNLGGSDLTAYIFCYYFFKLPDVLNKSPDLSVRKYSDLMLKQVNFPIQDMNKTRELKLEIGDYDFQSEDNLSNNNSSALALKEIENYFKMSPTFWKEYDIKKYQSYYTPSNIYVLVDSDVFSAAFSFTVILFKAGAKLIGTPPGQAGNCFIESPTFELPNTKLKIRVSDQYMISFPNDPDKGKLLYPDYLLTYDKYKSYNFDPNSEVLFALDIIEGI